MTAEASRESITFEVHDVERQLEPLPQERLFEILRKRYAGKLESCSDYHVQVCTRMDYHPLLAAVYTAYSLHRPLVLSPDAVWLTITHGVAQHMAVEGERLRSRLVAHQGRVNLEFHGEGWIAGTPENPWAEAFESWAKQIRQHVGPELHDSLLCDFSTSTPVTQAASRIVMMDIFEKYFRYECVAICGVPTITLRGSSQDWQHLAEKIEQLEIFDMPWWLEHLRPIAAQFVRASQGDIDREHWQNICKLSDAYGGHIINGWVARLFPYIRAFYLGPCALRNPIFETGRGFQTLVAPGGLSRVPIHWQDLQGNVRHMEAVGGLIGVTQDADSLALEPIAGWAIREQPGFEQLLQRVRGEHAVTEHPPEEMDLNALPKTPKEFANRHSSALPPDLDWFTREFVSVRFFPHDEECLLQTLPADQVEPLDWGEDLSKSTSRGPEDRCWHRFADLRDGRSLAINLDINLYNALQTEAQRQEFYRRPFQPICLYSEATRNRAGKNPIVAENFAELLKRLLDQSSFEQAYWEAAEFVSYGDAEEFTQR